MAKKQKTDAYRKLGRILIVLFVLLLLCGAGYWWMDRTVQLQEEENRLRADQENRLLQEQYEQAKAEDEQQRRDENAVDAQWPLPASSGWDVVDLTEYPILNAYSVNADRKQLLMGGMMLLNRWHAQPADFTTLMESELLGIHDTDKTIAVSGSGEKMFPKAIGALSEMLAAAKEDGLENFYVDEGYRYMASQQKYYEKEAAKHPDKTGDALIDKVVAAGVSYPGTSEYGSGLSFRIARYRKDDSEFNKVKFNTTEHSDWLVANSWKYGIICRFTFQDFPNATVTDKSYKTGMNVKANIYRYVGKGHAAVMHALDMCMEEYVEYLAKHPHIAVYEDGVLKYEITRSVVNADYGAEIRLSGNAVDYTASIDNMGGVIVCMSY